MSAQQPKVFVILGPTCSGKTALAMSLAQRFPMDVISVDSAMVYRGMDIGTAKPTPEELARVPHRLIDICDPADPYSAGRFIVDAEREIANSLCHERVPLLVGGTMLYHAALQFGMARLPPADPEIRAQLTARAEKLGWPSLHKELAVIDPDAAKRIEAADSQRIQRALEVYQITGRPISELQQQKHPAPYDFINIALVPSERALVHQRIESRFYEMLAQGFVEEVTALFKRDDLNLSLPSIRSVGYQQVWRYLQGEYDRMTMIDRGIIATRQLAKRQFTWLNQWRDIKRIDPERSNMLDEVLSHVQKEFD